MSFILIDALLASPDGSGIAQYERMLLEALARSPMRSRLVVLASRSWQPDGLAVHRLPAGRRWTRALSANLALPAVSLLHRKAFAAVHSLDYGVSPLLPSRIPVILTVHDIAFLQFPKFFGQATVAYKVRRLRAGLSKAKFIVVPSDTTRAELVDRLPVPPDRVRVVYPGVDETLSPRADEPTGPPTVGFLGQLTRRKNIETLVDAFHRLARRYPDLRLRLAGAPGPGWRSAQERIRRLPDPVRRRVDVLGPLPRQRVRSFLSSLTVFAFPSWWEGFGFPPLEAMACGVPVVASSAGSLPEVLGDAALFAPPHDRDLLATQIDRALTDNQLRQRLARQGVEQARRFSWSSAAAAVLEIYREIVDG